MRDELVDELTDGQSTHRSPVDDACESASATAAAEGMPTLPGDAFDGWVTVREMSSISG